MKPNSTQQEILLVTTTTFSKKHLCEKDVRKSDQDQKQHQQLEEACWNGLLEELMPEIMVWTASGKRLYLWHIRSGDDFLQMEWSEFPLSVEKQFSIDTHFFLPVMVWN